MERDFMGLCVKQETPDEIIDAAPVRMQWSFSSNGCAHPQLLSFQTCQDDPKTGVASKKSRYNHNRPIVAPAPAAPLGSNTNDLIRYCEHTDIGIKTNNINLRNSSKIPAQLTIFYNGSVCVYDNISPEKAEAIMLLAGNGPTANVIAAEPLKSITPNFFSSGTVPQFRRKSLARFLEKRKERVITASPYAAAQIKSPASGSSPLSAIN